MTKGQLLQDPFLNSLRKGRIPVSIYLINGIKLHGQVESFDQYVVLLRNSVTQMLFRLAPFRWAMNSRELKKQKPYSGLSISKGRRDTRKGVARLCHCGPRNSSRRGA